MALPLKFFLKRPGWIFSPISRPFSIRSMIDKFPREMFKPKQLDVIDAIRNKTGIMELKSGKMNKNKTNFDIVYDMNEKTGNSAKHILDLINSIYVLSK